MTTLTQEEKKREETPQETSSHKEGTNQASKTRGQMADKGQT